MARRHSIVSLLLVALWTGVAGAQGLLPGPARRDRGPDLRGHFDVTRPGELPAFFDGVLGEQMAMAGTPGAVVVVVKGQKVLFARGYGDADMEAERPVDPETTIFRIGSVSKLVTATAIMQLEEQGLLSLDDDVTLHLGGLHLPGGYEAPILIRHLLTHTAGLDDDLVGIAARDDAPLPTLREYLEAHPATRIFPPGERFHYSQYGFTLLGHVVEQVSGVDFDLYTSQEIFRPLGMWRAGFRHRPQHEEQLAQPYRVDPETRLATRLPRYEFKVAPAANLRASGTDMARFMITFLNGGELQGKRILRPDTVQRMLTRQFTHHPALPGMALGWFTGPRGVGHAGGSAPHVSSAVLVPSQGLGVFFSTNALQGARLFRAVTSRFLMRYLPRVPPGLPGPVHDLDHLAGTYRSSFYSHGSPLTGLFVLNPWFPELEVQVPGDGTLEVHHGLSEEPGILLPTEDPWLFRRADGGGSFAFIEGADGAVEAAALSSFFPLLLDRIPATRSRSVHQLLALLIFLGLVLTGPLWLLRRLVGALSSVTRCPGYTGAWDRLRALTATAALGVLAAPFLALVPLHGSLPGFCFGYPTAARVLLRFAPMIAALAGLCVAQTLVALTRETTGRRSLAVGAASLAGFVAFAWSWHLLGP